LRSIPKMLRFWCWLWFRARRLRHTENPPQNSVLVAILMRYRPSAVNATGAAA
jgi:hypothetical protein